MNYKLYKFSAPWCGQCKVLAKRLEGFIPENCEFTEIDVDEAEDEVLDKYQIRNIPVTILLDEDEKIIKKWVGVFDTNEIEEEIKKAEAPQEND